MIGEQYTTVAIESQMWQQVAMSHISFSGADTDVERRYNARDSITYTVSEQDVDVVMKAEEGMSHCRVEFRESHRTVETVRVSITEIAECIDETLRYVSVEE
jgi:hypothetical protein